MLFLFLYGLVVPEVAWKSPKLSLVLELVSEIMWVWCWWGSPLPPCLLLLHMRVLAAHPQCWLGILYHVYDLLTPHTHGPLLLFSFGSSIAYRLVKIWFLKACQMFSPNCISYHCSQAFSIPPVLRISRYAILTTFPPGIGVLESSANSTTSSIFQKGPSLVLGATIIASFSAHFHLCPWVIWSHDHHKGAGRVPQVCAWNNLCRPGVAPWSTSTPVIIKVSASGYLPHLPFVAIGPLGLHEAECTLEFQMNPYWLALDLLVGGGPGAENIAQLQCGIWLVALPARGYHAVPLPIMAGWLTR